MFRAASSMSTASNTSNPALRVIMVCPMENKGSGIRPIRYLRVRITPPTPGRPKSSAARFSTLPRRTCVTLPINAVAPTMKSEYAVASTASTWNR